MHCYCTALQFSNRYDSKHLSPLKSVKSFPCISSFNSHFSPVKLVWFFFKPPFQRRGKRGNREVNTLSCVTKPALLLLSQCLGMKNNIAMLTEKSIFPFLNPYGSFLMAFWANIFFRGRKEQRYAYFTRSINTDNIFFFLPFLCFSILTV